MKDLKIKFRWETKFKETEIGEIPKDWEVKKLGEVVEVEWGNTNLTKKIYKEDGYPVFSATGQDGYADFYEREGEAVIVSAIGAYCGVCFYAKNKWTAIKNTLVLQNKKIPCDIKFLFYFLNDKEKWPELGSGQPFISKSAAEEVLIVYPPLPEQSRIATVLSWFDDLIEVKKRQNEILEKTAMAIFKSWFIDFEPFRDGEFVYSEELGKEIPKGWEVDKTIRLIDYNPSVSIEEGKVFPFVEMKDVSTNSLACDFSFKTFTGSGVRYFGGDTLMARITPSLEHGKTAFVWFISEKENGFGSTEFFVLHPKKSYLKEFVYLLAKSNDFREVAINSMSGTSGRQRADINALKNYLIPIPPSPILQSFHSLVEPLFQKIILNQKQIMTLRKIRDTLLPLLVFGKLRVEEV
jgi:type I restriction enzyme S subunit